MAMSISRRLTAAGLLGATGLWGCQTVSGPSTTASRQTTIPALSGAHVPPLPNSVASSEIEDQKLPTVMSESIPPIASTSLSGPPPFPTESRPAIPAPPRTLTEALGADASGPEPARTGSKVIASAAHFESEVVMEQWKPTPSSGRSRASGISVTPVANWVQAGCAPVSKENVGPTDPVSELESRVNAVEEQLSSARNDMKTVHQTLKVSEDRIGELSRELSHWQRETKRLESEMRAQQQADLKSLDELTAAVNVLIEKQRLAQTRNGEVR